MKLEHSFTVPVPVEQAWPVLMDVQRIAPCMPGATLEQVDGEEFRGRVRVKVGPITVSYQGVARFAEVDETSRRVVLEASGKEPKGSGSVKALITANLRDDGPRTAVDVSTDLAITGKPAQFGRGLLEDIGEKIIGQFADNLASEIEHPATASAGEPAATAPSEAGSATRLATPASSSPSRPAEPSLDLMSTVAPVVIKRAAPLACALLALLLLIRWVRR
jgi:carbon monoxide dehydrogenase subunit G